MDAGEGKKEQKGEEEDRHFLRASCQPGLLLSDTEFQIVQGFLHSN